MMAALSLQEWLAIGIVAVVVAGYWLRAFRRRAAGSGGCAGCNAAKAKSETVVRWYRR